MATSITDKPMCSICLNEFQQPKILDCHHSFCFTCLEGYINKVSTNNQFPCPLCRHIVNIPVGGIMDFTSNIGVKQELVSDICQADVPPCDVCKYGVDSEFRCEDCEQYLCSSCRTIHDGLKGCRGHLVVGVIAPIGKSGEDSTKPKYKDVCPNHHDKEVRCYCKDCSIAVCSDCFVTDHMLHKYVDLHGKNIDGQARDELEDLKDNIATYISQFETFCELLTKIKTDIDKSARTSCAAVDQRVEQIYSEAKQVGEEIKNEIQKSRDEEIDKMIKLFGEMGILIEDLKASVKCTVDVIADKSIVQVLNRIPQVEQEKEKSSLRMLDIPVVKYTWFDQSAIDETLLIKQLGTLLYQEQSTFTTSFNLDDVVRQGMKGEYGGYYNIQGLSWRIEAVKIEGTDTEPTLGIYIRLSETADIKSCQASRRLTLINTKDKRESVSREYGSHTFNPGKGWGWTGFTDWNRLSDKQNGFIDDNKNFTIQATVKVLKIDRD